MADRDPAAMFNVAGPFGGSRPRPVGGLARRGTVFNGCHGAGRGGSEGRLDRCATAVPRQSGPRGGDAERQGCAGDRMLPHPSGSRAGNRATVRPSVVPSTGPRWNPFDAGVSRAWGDVVRRGIVGPHRNGAARQVGGRAVLVEARRHQRCLSEVFRLVTQSVGALFSRIARGSLTRWRWRGAGARVGRAAAAHRQTLKKQPFPRFCTQRLSSRQPGLTSTAAVRDSL